MTDSLPDDMPPATAGVFADPTVLAFLGQGVSVTRGQAVTWTRVPHWLVESVSPRAVAAYLTLGRWTDTHDWPSMSAIADVMGCSIDTVRNSIRELETVGAVRVVPRYTADGGRMSNSYVLLGLSV